MNDYKAMDERFGYRQAAALRRHGLDLIPFPYSPSAEPGPDPDIASAVGVYINFLQIEGMIICPVYRQEHDARALRVLTQAFPASSIVPLDCRDLAAEGGVLNCVTWNIREGTSVRT